MRPYVPVLFVLSLFPSLLKADEPSDYAVKMNLSTGYSLANFYCLNRAWPKNLNELQKHDVKNAVIYLSEKEWEEVINMATCFLLREI